MFFFFTILPKTKDLGRMWIDALGCEAHVYETQQALAIFFIPVFKWGKTYTIEANGDVYTYHGKNLMSLTWSDLEVIKKGTSVCPHCGMPITDDSYAFCPHCGKPL